MGIFFSSDLRQANETLNLKLAALKSKVDLLNNEVFELNGNMTVIKNDLEKLHSSIEILTKRSYEFQQKFNNIESASSSSQMKVS